MNPHTLFYFAGRCLTLDEHPGLRDSVCEGFSSGKIPAGDFIIYCDAQLVLPAVYLKLKKHDLTGAFEPELLEHLEYVCSMNRRRNEAIMGQVDEISAALAESGIQPVYLKGAAHILDGLYEDICERLMGDIDFLVKEDDYYETAAILKQLGYDYWWLHGNVPEWKHGSGTDHHYHALLREGMQASVELHRIPVSKRYSGKFTADLVVREKQSIEGRKNCFVPVDAHKIAHNFIHRQLANSGYRLKKSTLRDIYDLYLLSGRTDPRNSLSQIMARHRVKAMGYFLFASSALGPGGKFYTTENTRAKRHCFLCRMALKHPRMSSVYRKVLQLGSLIFKTYLWRIVKAVYQKSSREHILRRIKAPSWYREHLAKLRAKFLR